MSDSPAEAFPPGRRLGGMAVRFLAVIGGIAVLWGIGATVNALLAPRRAPAQVEAKADKQPFAVSEVTALRGTNLNEIVIATEISVGRGGSGYSSYSGGERADERNVILLDKASGQSRKLLPDNSRAILDREYLPAAAAAAGDDAEDAPVQGSETARKTEPPFAYYLFRVRAGAGKEDVLVGDLASGSQAFLLTGIDGVDKVWMQSPTRVALLMRQGRKLFYRAIEIPQLKMVAARPVEID